MGFLVTLPSSSSESTFPDNTISNFTTYLPYEISLDGEYEVALTEIQYTNSFYNVPEDCDIILRMTEFDGVELASYGVERTATLRKGYYDDIDDLLSTIRKVIVKQSPNTIKNDFDMKYMDNSRKIKIMIPKNTIDFRILFPETLQAILGVGRGYYSQTSQGLRPADMNICAHSMYIYSNIVSPRIVGDSQVPLLRVLAVHGTHNEYVMESFYHLQYIPVALRNFRTIEIDLRNNLGQPMPFHSGEAVLSLHFRRALR